MRYGISSCIALGLSVFSPIALGVVIIKDEVCFRHSLVLVEVDQVDVHGNVRDQKLVVRHVYKGPKTLETKEFVVTSPVTSQGSVGISAFYPPLERGEQLIWPVQEDAGVSSAVPSTRIQFDFLPARATDREGDFPSALGWAEAVQDVVNLNNAARLPKLKVLAISDNPRTSAWAIDIIAEVSSTDLQHLSAEILRDDAPLAAQISLDAALCRIDAGSWRNSDERYRMMDNWIARAHLRSEVTAILTRLELAIVRSELASPRLVQLIERIIKDSQVDALVRRRAITIVQRVINDDSVSQAVFELLAGQVESSADFRIQAAAVSAFGSMKQFSQDQRTRLVAMRDQIAEQTKDSQDKKDPRTQLVESLNRVIARFNKQPDRGS